MIYCKYISHKSTSSSFSIVASNTGEEAALEGEKTFSNVVQEERPASHTGEEVESSSSSDEESAAQIIPSISMKDIGLWPNKIDNNTRVFLVRQGPFAIQNLDADFSEGVKRPNNTIKAKGETRKLSQDWFFQILPNGEKLLRSWMVYSPSKKSIYCFCCKLFDNLCQAGFNTENGFNKWWKLNPKISQHEVSPLHIRSYSKWKELEIRLGRGATIDKLQQQNIDKEIKKWKEILTRILDIIRFLAKQNLAFRGHRESVHQENIDSMENRGNFLELVDLLAKYDPVLREHVVKIKMGNKYSISYLSPKIQNEFIELLGGAVRKTIMDQIKQAKYFCIIFDSTPDISHKDQTSQIIRYVVIDGSEVKVVESFIDFVETKGKTAGEITDMILTKLENDGLDIKNCRGQAYDNAAVMAGKHSGVQTRIKEINPNAEFVACTNHSLNLACLHAASTAINSITFFGTIEQLFSLFSSSTHRWNVLLSVTGQGVKRSVETRWSARAAAVTIVKKHFFYILSALEKLTSEEENSKTRSDAGVLLNSMQSFSFLCYLHLWEPVLLEINDAQKYLQIKGLNVHQCHIKLNSLQTHFMEQRDTLVQNAVIAAKIICEELEISTERRVRRRKNMSGENSRDVGLSLEEEVRREMFSSMDRIIKEIKERFDQLHGLVRKYSCIIPCNLLNEEFECQINDLIDIDKEQFHIERKRIQVFMAVPTLKEEAKHWKNGEKGPLDLLKFIQQYRLENSVPNIVILLRIFLTISISVASCERSFSKLKLIKNYLRSTMSQLRLQNLAILSIEQEITNNINFESIIHDFSSMKARRVDII